MLDIAEQRISHARKLLSGPGVAGHVSPETGSRQESRLPFPITTPHWDSITRTLFFGDVVVKQFKEPAANQELILVSFQELNWPPRIDDPLPPVAGLDSKKRLHDAIQSLNRNQINAVIRFHGDGTGLGVCWERLG